MEEPGRAWQYTGYRQKSRPPVQNSAQYTTTRYSTITKLVPAAARTGNSARQTAPPYQYGLPWQIFLAIPGARALLSLLSGASVLSVWNVCPDCIASLSVLLDMWAWSWLVFMVCGTGTATPSQPECGIPQPARARLPARGGPRMAAKSRYGAVGMAQVAHLLQTARHQLKPAPVPKGVTTVGPHAAIAALQSKV